MTVPAIRAACVTAAAAALLAIPAVAQAKTKTVDMGLPAANQDEFNTKYGADVNDFFPHTVTIHAGDKVRFRPVAFHTVDIPRKGGSILPLFLPTGQKITGLNDAAGDPFWFNGQDQLGINPVLLASNFGKTLTYRGKRIDSGAPLGPNLKPMTVRFRRKGTVRFFCDIHPGMRGKVIVKRKGAKIPTAKQDRRRVRKQLARDRRRAKKLSSVVPAGDTIYTGGSAAGGVEHFAMLPATKTVPVGTTVRFMMSPKSFDSHTATFGPGDPQADPNSYLGMIAASFQGTNLDPRGVYPSQQPPGVADYSSALHGNGFWNSGVMDNAAASLPAPYNDVKFTAPGTYDFYCMIHPFMHGKVIVQ